MYKKSIITFLLIWVSLSVSVMAQNDYVMFFSESLNPLPGHATELVKGTKAHNAKFHVSGEDKAYLFSILTGPRSGQFVWVEGPMKFANLDKAISDEHSMDWDKNTAVHCQTSSSIKIMIRNDDLTYNPENEVVADNYLARVFYGISDKATLLEAIGMVKDVFVAKKWTTARRVYESAFRSKDNDDVALVYPFKSFSFFEKYNGIPTDNLEKDFEEVHGAGSFTKFQEMMNNSCDGWYDEVRTLVK